VRFRARLVDSTTLSEGNKRQGARAKAHDGRRRFDRCVSGSAFVLDAAAPVEEAAGPADAAVLDELNGRLLD